MPADAFSRLVQDQTLLVLPVFGSGDHYRVTLPADAENANVLAQLKPFGVHAAAGMTPSECVGGAVWGAGSGLGSN